MAGKRFHTAHPHTHLENLCRSEAIHIYLLVYVLVFLKQLKFCCWAFEKFFPKRYQSGLIKSIVYPWVCEDVPYENFPAMAYARTSAGPAGRPGACIFQIGCHFLISRIFFFESRSLVDFQIGNEPSIAHGVHFFFGNRSLVDFQIGNDDLGRLGTTWRRLSSPGGDFLTTSWRLRELAAIFGDFLTTSWRLLDDF